MKKLFFKEFANYGYEQSIYSKPKGGTDAEPGEELFKPIDGAAVIDELARFDLGPVKPCLKWHDLVEWGSEAGAFQAVITTLGSLKVIVRRKTIDLQGESVWICKHVHALNDAKDQNKEIDIAHTTYEMINEMSKEMIDGPAQEFKNFEKFAYKFWAGVRKDHPSYCMFPTMLRKQDENYYKMVFEFRGQGVGNAESARSRIEQFDIDLYWDAKKGLIRCFGYNIESTTARHKWEVAPSEWDEYFSPAQDPKKIIECVTRIFLQY